MGITTSPTHSTDFYQHILAIHNAFTTMTSKHVEYNKSTISTILWIFTIIILYDICETQIIICSMCTLVFTSISNYIRFSLLSEIVQNEVAFVYNLLKILPEFVSVLRHEYSRYGIETFRTFGTTICNDFASIWYNLVNCSWCYKVICSVW